MSVARFAEIEEWRQSKPPVVGSHYSLAFCPASFTPDHRAHEDSVSCPKLISLMAFHVLGSGYRIYRRIELTIVAGDYELLAAYVPEAPAVMDASHAIHLARPFVLVPGEKVHVSVRLVGEPPPSWWRYPVWLWHRFRAWIADRNRRPSVHVAATGIVAA